MSNRKYRKCHKFLGNQQDWSPSAARRVPSAAVSGQLTPLCTQRDRCVRAGPGAGQVCTDLGRGGTGENRARQAGGDVSGATPILRCV